MYIAFWTCFTRVLAYRILWKGKGYFNEDYPLEKKKLACEGFAFATGVVITIVLRVIL